VYQDNTVFMLDEKSNSTRYSRVETAARQVNLNICNGRLNLCSSHSTHGVSRYT